MKIMERQNKDQHVVDMSVGKQEINANPTPEESFRVSNLHEAVRGPESPVREDRQDEHSTGLGHDPSKLGGAQNDEQGIAEKIADFLKASSLELGKWQAAVSEVPVITDSVKVVDFIQFVCVGGVKCHTL